MAVKINTINQYASGIYEIWVQTGSVKNADALNVEATIRVCDSIGNCCTTDLEDPEKDDRARGALDKYSNCLLYGCLDTPTVGQLTITLEKEASNGWVVDWVKIFLVQGSSYTCHIGKWLLKSASHTGQCIKGNN